MNAVTVTAKVQLDKIAAVLAVKPAPHSYDVKVRV